MRPQKYISFPMQRLGNWMYALSLFSSAMFLISPLTLGLSVIPGVVGVTFSVIVAGVIIAQTRSYREDRFARNHAINLCIAYAAIFAFSIIPVIMFLKKVENIWVTYIKPTYRYFFDLNTLHNTAVPDPVSFFDVQIGVGFVVLYALLTILLKIFLTAQAFVFFSETESFRL